MGGGRETTVGAIKQIKGFKNKVFPNKPGLVRLVKITLTMEKYVS